MIKCLPNKILNHLIIRALIIQEFELKIVSSHSPVDAAAHDEDSRLVHGEADSVGRTIASVPSPAGARSSESKFIEKWT